MALGKTSLDYKTGKKFEKIYISRNRERAYNSKFSKIYARRKGRSGIYTVRKKPV